MVPDDTAVFAAGPARGLTWSASARLASATSPAASALSSSFTVADFPGSSFATLYCSVRVSPVAVFFAGAGVLPTTVTAEGRLTSTSALVTSILPVAGCVTVSVAS